MRPKYGFFLAGVMWLGIGLLLLSRGLNYLKLLMANHDTFVLFDSIGAKAISTDMKSYALVSLGIVMGFFKAHLTLKKMVEKNFVRISNMDKVSLFKIYPLNSWLIIFFMMGMGMSLRLLPIPRDIYSLILIAVGSALIQGGIFYFRGVPYLSRQQ